MLAALDIGNSKTDLVLVDEEGKITHWARTGVMAPSLVGTDETVRRARQMLPGGVGVTTTWVGAAGADFPDQEDALAKAFEAEEGFGRVLVRNDIHALLACGRSDGAAIAVVGGAGMNMVGSGAGGEVRFAALGRASGDRGGGLYLGEQALTAACRAADGRGESTQLLDGVLKHFSASSADQLSRWLDEGRIAWLDLMGLAPLVLASARAGDPVGLRLVDDHAGEVVLCIRTIASRMGCDLRSTSVVLGGSVLRHGRDLFEPRLRQGLGPETCNLEFPDFPPVVGAALSVLRAVGAPARAEQIVDQLSHLEPEQVP